MCRPTTPPCSCSWVDPLYIKEGDRLAGFRHDANGKVPTHLVTGVQLLYAPVSSVQQVGCAPARVGPSSLRLCQPPSRCACVPRRCACLLLLPLQLPSLPRGS